MNHRRYKGMNEKKKTGGERNINNSLLYNFQERGGLQLEQRRVRTRTRRRTRRRRRTRGAERLRGRREGRGQKAARTVARRTRAVQAAPRKVKTLKRVVVAQAEVKRRGRNGIKEAVAEASWIGICSKICGPRRTGLGGCRTGR